MPRSAASEGVYICEDVSNIEYRGGLFYLTDDLGTFKLTRAMRPSTFFRCVAGAARIIDEFEKLNSDAAELLARH